MLMHAGKAGWSMSVQVLLGIAESICYNQYRIGICKTGFSGLSMRLVFDFESYIPDLDITFVF